MGMGKASGKDKKRSPDCVTRVRMGNSVLVVSGFFKEGATSTADDMMERVIQAEGAALHTGEPQ
jgi:hypothetical protein